MGYSSGLYDLIAASLSLPVGRTLNKYTIPNANKEDGIMFQNIIKEQVLFDQRFPNANHLDWEHHVSLG